MSEMSEMTEMPTEMQRFRVRVTRSYVSYEEAEIEIRAASIEQALEDAKELEIEGGLDPEWSEFDGAAESTGYRWTVTAPDGTILTGEGTHDDKHAAAALDAIPPAA